MALLEPEFEDPLDVILVFSCFYEIFVGSLNLLNRCSGDFFDTSLLWILFLSLVEILTIAFTIVVLQICHERCNWSLLLGVGSLRPLSLHMGLPQLLSFKDSHSVLINEHILLNCFVMLHDQALSLWPHELLFVYSCLVLNYSIIISAKTFNCPLELRSIPKRNQIRDVRLKVGKRWALSLKHILSFLVVLLLLLDFDVEHNHQF